MQAIRNNSVNTKSFEFIPGVIQFLYILGTFISDNEGIAGSGVISKSPGMIVYDERQDQDATVKTYVGASLGFKQDCKTITGGTSRTPGNPLEQEWMTSDMKACLYKCGHCGSWNQPRIVLEGKDWYSENILTLDEPKENDEGVLTKHIMVCDHCGSDMDHCRGRYGHLDDGSIIEWVPQHLNNDQTPYLDYSSGYQYTRFEVGHWSLTKTILEIEDPTKTEREVNNEILGEAYAGSDVPFNDTVIAKCKWKEMNLGMAQLLKAKLTIGTIDWGKAPGSYAYVDKWLPDGRTVFSAINCIQGDERLHGKKAGEYLYRHGCDIVICDYGHKIDRELDLFKPDGPFEREQVFCVEYDPSRHRDRTSEPIEKLDASKAVESGYILINRNYAIEQCARRLSAGLREWIIPYKNPSEVDPYLNQMRNLFRIDPEDKKRKAFTEIKSPQYLYAKGGPDHMAHLKILASLATHRDLQGIFERFTHVY